eukprot:scaffold47544_cov59-Phaeocystis_antarctica.AAC.1
MKRCLEAGGRHGGHMCGAAIPRRPPASWACGPPPRAPAAGRRPRRARGAAEGGRRSEVGEVGSEYAPWTATRFTSRCILCNDFDAAGGDTARCDSTGASMTPQHRGALRTWRVAAAVRCVAPARGGASSIQAHQLDQAPSSVAHQLSRPPWASWARPCPRHHCCGRRCPRRDAASSSLSSPAHEGGTKGSLSNGQAARREAGGRQAGGRREAGGRQAGGRREARAGPGAKTAKGRGVAMCGGAAARLLVLLLLVVLLLPVLPLRLVLRVAVAVAVRAARPLTLLLLLLLLLLL